MPLTGLPADYIDGDLRKPSKYTSPTNIGGYLWSTVVARDLGIIGGRDAAARIGKTLGTLRKLQGHNGMFFNLYDPATGEVLRIWPEDGSPAHPFVSSVDNGWLAAALDQAMVLGAIGVESLRAAFGRGEVERTIQPLLAIEEFSD